MTDSRSTRPARSTASLRRRGAVAVAATALATASLGVASPAFAKHGDGGGHGGRADVRTSVSCASGGTLKLRGKADDATFQVEVEMDSNVAGQSYVVALSHNDAMAWSDTFTTAGPSGSFSVDRVFDPAAPPVTPPVTPPTTGGGTDDDSGGAADDDPGADDGTTGGTTATGSGTVDDNPTGADDTTAGGTAAGGGTARGDDHPHGRDGLRAHGARAAAAADAATPAKHTFTVTATRQGSVPATPCVATVQL